MDIIPALFFAAAAALLSAAPLAQPPSPVATSAASDAAPPVAVPVLDVVSIKPNQSGGAMMGMRYTPDGFQITNGSVHTILLSAYDTNEDQLIAEPAWAKTERFNVDAKVTGPEAATVSKLTPAQRQLMLRQMLRDHFGLVTHNETRELPIFLVTIAKSGSKLQKSEPAPDGSEPKFKLMAGNDRVDAHDVPISILTMILSHQLGRTVIDKTGLTDKYEITLRWTPDEVSAPQSAGAHETSPSDSSAPSIFTALQEQLGLKLDSAKGPVNVIVIDHIERPEEN